MRTLQLMAIIKSAVDPAAGGGGAVANALYGLGTLLLLVCAPALARADGAADGHDYQFCHGYYALCSASTCKPTGKHIRVNVTGGGTAIFPEVDCTCPIFYGLAHADLTGGNMQGSCQSPGPGQIWSLYFPKEKIPQQINNWVTTGREAKAPLQVCPKSFNVANETSNCFSFACDSETYINGVPVATCHCPMGESFAGTPLPAQTSFATQVGQRDPQFCFQHPVSIPFALQ
jgi:hypothetical protein